MVSTTTLGRLSLKPTLGHFLEKEEAKKENPLLYNSPQITFTK